MLHTHNLHHARRAGLSFFVHLVKLSAEKLEKIIRRADPGPALDKETVIVGAERVGDHEHPVVLFAVYGGEGVGDPPWRVAGVRVGAVQRGKVTFSVYLSSAGSLVRTYLCTRELLAGSAVTQEPTSRDVLASGSSLESIKRLADMLALLFGVRSMHGPPVSVTRNLPSALHPSATHLEAFVGEHLGVWARHFKRARTCPSSPLPAVLVE